LPIRFYGPSLLHYLIGIKRAKRMKKMEKCAKDRSGLKETALMKKENVFTISAE
jgi:hypothetical protein